MGKKTRNKRPDPQQAKWYEIVAQATSDGAYDATIHIYGDIGESFFGEESVTAKSFVEEINSLNADKIAIRINSYGGSVADGLAIFNAIRRHRAETHTFIDGVAFSIASLIAMAGEIVFMAENALMMIHAPWGMSVGNAEDMRDMADVLDKHAEAMSSAYDGLADEYLKDGEDHYFTADEALAAGFVDEIGEKMAIAASLVAQARARFTQRNEVGKMPKENIAQNSAQKDEQTPKSAPERQASNPANIAEIQDAAINRERERISARNAEIDKIFGPMLADGHAFKALAEDVRNAAFKDPDMTVDMARAKLLSRIGAENSPPVASGHFTQATLVEDGRDKVKAGLADAISFRMRISQEDPRNEFRGLSLSDMAARCLRASGHRTDGMTKSEIAGKVLAMHTSSDFNYLLMDAANKKLQQAYGNFPSTWRMVALPGETTDFKTVNLIRMGSFNSLDIVPEGHEYKQGTIGEEREQLTPETRGKYIQLTRQMIVNDDLNGFTRMATLLGRAAARTVNKDVYDVLNNNGNMSDGIPLFDAGHNNLAGSGGAISVATLSAGRAAMRKQTAPGANATEYLNIMPAVLAVPVVLEDLAREVVSSDYNTDVAASRKRNPIRDWGPLEVVSDPYLDAASATAWYLVSDPMDVPLIEVHFLDGQQEPFVDTNEEFLTDAVQWKVRLDYGLTANDWRGGYKNAGA